MIHAGLFFIGGDYLAAPSMKDYKNSGFYGSANIAALQKQLSKYKLTDKAAQKQAKAIYGPAFNMQKTTYQNQLAELAASRDRDVNKLNQQYGKNLNTIMSGLNQRRLGRSSLVSTRGVENENARLGAISDTSFNYLKQENEINANLQQAQAEYAQNVENKAVELKREYQAQYINLQAQIAQLQSQGYSAYANYLLNKGR